MKITNKYLLLLTASFSLVAFNQAYAVQKTPDPGQALQQDSDKQLSIALPTDPNLRWEAYLESSGLVEGVNTRGDKTFFIARGEAQVGKPLNDKGFIKSRTVAFERALLSAKSDMAESVGSVLDSTRSLKLFEQGNELPPAMENVKEELSIMDKARTLTSLALDDRIKRFDPTWDGTGKSKEEKQQKLAVQTEKYHEELNQKARLFLQGASPIFNAEGPSDMGYTVVVGIVWSPNMAKVAEAMYNPSVSLSPGPKKASIRQQIQNMMESNPDSLASTMGVRIWRDENGDRTVVSFAAVRGTGSPTIAKKKSALRARAQMAQFVSENMLSNGGLSGDETIISFDDDTSEAFDEENFNQTIIATAKTIKINGASTVYSWKGKHPNSKKKMFVNVLAWSPSSRKLAIDMEERAVTDKEKMDTMGKKKANVTQGKPASQGGVATGGLSGAQTSPDDF